MHTLAAALRELEDQRSSAQQPGRSSATSAALSSLTRSVPRCLSPPELPRDRFHVKLVFENYVHIKLEKGHKKTHVAQKLDVLENALVAKGVSQPWGPRSSSRRL